MAVSQFSRHQVIAGRQSVGAVESVLADLDRDGDLDVLVGATGDNGLGWYENLGNGDFARSVDIGPGVEECNGVLAADLDGDGHQDVVVTSSGAESASWFRNLGGGAFGPRQTVSDSIQGLRDADAADMDGDGDLDVVVGAEPDRVLWVENLGGGVFDPMARFVGTLPAASTGAVVQAVDLDSDGQMDIVTAAHNDAGAFVFRNLGAGASWAMSTHGLLDPFVGLAIDSGDFE